MLSKLEQVLRSPFVMRLFFRLFLLSERSNSVLKERWSVILIIAVFYGLVLWNFSEAMRCGVYFSKAHALKVTSAGFWGTDSNRLDAGNEQNAEGKLRSFHFDLKYKL